MSRTDHIQFESSGLPEDLTLVGFRGTEAISRPYEFEIFVRVVGFDDLDDALGARATLTMDHGLDEAHDYAIHGVITGVDVLEENAESALVRVVLSPQLALLELGSHSRIFTDMELPDILEEIFRDNGLSSDDYELRLRGTYGKQEHVCQYKETDLAFVSRWMEREGIHYYFEQGERSEKLIVSDQGSSHDTIAPGAVRYHPVASGSDGSHGTSFQSFRCRKASRPANVKLRDFDYLKPKLDVSGGAGAYSPGQGEVNIHGYRFFTPDDGARLATICAEELLSQQTLFTAHGTTYHLRPGYTFELEGHPISRLDASYLCVELRHHANLGARTAGLRQLTGLRTDETYGVEVVGVLSTVKFKPARLTPWPRVFGYEIAVVDGPEESDYAQVEDNGRYHVRVFFDEHQHDDGEASAWLRMMQPHGGNPEGFHFPLRKGTEVFLCFLGGDPDRPLIAGAVPNAENPSVVTSKNATRNIVHTGSDNHLEFEDLSGKQWIDIRTPPKNTFLHLGTPHDADSHYIVLNTAADCLYAVGTNQDIDVGAELHETVQGAVSETYNATQLTRIQGPQTTTVTKTGCKETYESTQTTIVTGAVTEEYQAGHKTQVDGGSRLEVFSSGQHTKVSGGEAQFTWSGGSHLRVVSGATTDQHNCTLGVTATGAVVQLFPSTVSQTWGTTTAHFASINIVVSGATSITCPELDIHVPLENYSFLSVTWTLGFQCQISFVNSTEAAIQVQANGIGIAMAELNLTINALALSVNGVNIGVNRPKAETHGLDQTVGFEITL